ERVVHRFLPLLSLPLLAAALVGCAGDAILLDPVAGAATRTARLSSARFDFDASFAVAGRAVRARGTGVYDRRARRGRIAYTMTSPGKQVRGEGTVDFRNGLVAYLELPALSARLPAGRRWVRFDLGRAMQAEGLDAGTLLAAISEAQDSRRVGRARIRG